MNTAFDRAGTLRRFLGKKDLLARAIGMFLDQAPVLVDRLQACLAAGDTQGACEHAHTLKGAAGTVGAVQVARLAHRMQEAVASDRDADVADELRAALDQFSRLAAPDATGNQ